MYCKRNRHTVTFLTKETISSINVYFKIMHLFRTRQDEIGYDVSKRVIMQKETKNLSNALHNIQTLNLQQLGQIQIDGGGVSEAVQGSKRADERHRTGGGPQPIQYAQYHGFRSISFHHGPSEVLGEMKGGTTC